MQQAPVRLSQTIWSAFRAAKPVHRPFNRACQFSPLATRRPSSQEWSYQRSTIAIQARYYSDKKSEVDRKVEDAKNRIDDSLDSRAEAVSQTEQTLKNPQDETIVHTIPESSSIVHTSPHRPQKYPDPKPQSQPDPSPSSTPIPDSVASRYAHLQKRFGHFMDNFQTHVFTASRRLNDLTGYSGIEALKNEIETQESTVQNCRQEVKTSREKYSEAITQRSNTQREVNDLLHRKHTWSPSDLERFTSLYRSDHANEQTEAAAQKRVGDAEARYEEASTKLAKAILARYHEEQIWSDKIRQMSTWGTWGLMGLNVLLFVIFQVVLEPWRRRRLVKGFEEKVELAIKETGEARNAAVTAGAVQPNQSAGQAVEDLTAGQKVEAVADNIAGQIVDAITGASDEVSSEATPPSQANIEAVADTLTTGEIAVEEGLLPGSPDIPLMPEPTSLASQAGENGSSRWTSPTSTLGKYEDWLRSLFSEDHMVLVSQRDLTTVAMEGVAGGMAVMGLLFVLLRPR
ncbi:sensitivity to high expression protein she9 [Cladophialophora chaetospira]|uniref:Sensitive to high expression protein 9, mitochondrial n=1 Tax=Cladophialophora chaetospira TaxID=386627 RepID=A0AA38X061_9EURO|nr:sensitivity to high expression protein she9 [Cladophialophora chaetospira]